MNRVQKIQFIPESFSTDNKNKVQKLHKYVQHKLQVMNKHINSKMWNVFQGIYISSAIFSDRKAGILRGASQQNPEHALSSSVVLRVG